MNEFEPEPKRGLVGLLGKVPWLVWAFIAPVFLWLPCQLMHGEGRRVPVVGAGPIHALVAEDAPEGGYFELEAVPSERLEASQARVHEAITLWPDVVVFGFDAAVVDGGEAPEAATYGALVALATAAENATAVPIVVYLAAEAGADEARIAAVDRVDAQLASFCALDGLRLCFDPRPHVADPGALRRALAAAVAEGLERHRQLRLSTQVGR